MRTMAPKALITGVVFAAVALSSGCKSGSSNASFLPKTYEDKLPGSTGSIENINRKLARAREADAAKTKLEPILITVVHDAAGKPTAAELRRSSGDAGVDARALEMVMKKRTFPRGEANTVLIEINPKSVPKASAGK